MTPKISINIVSYNRADYLKQALDSVLAQDFSNWEIIFIDDASTDDTAEIVEPYLGDLRIKYFRNERNMGIGFSRNRALQESRGEFIAVLDSDDYWLSASKLREQLSFLDDHPETIAIGTSAIKVDEHNAKVGEIISPTENIKKSILWKNPIIHSSALYRKEPALSVGGYEKDVDLAEDYGLWLRLGTSGKLANLPGQYIAYRVHQGNISTAKRRALIARHFSLLKKYRAEYPGYYSALLKRSLQFLRTSI